jgi:hypothetical protein
MTRARRMMAQGVVTVSLPIREGATPEERDQIAAVLRTALRDIYADHVDGEEGPEDLEVMYWGDAFGGIVWEE